MLQKSEGFRFGVAKGELVVSYCDPLAAQNLEFSGFCNIRVAVGTLPSILSWIDRRVGLLDYSLVDRCMLFRA